MGWGVFFGGERGITELPFQWRKIYALWTRSGWFQGAVRKFYIRGDHLWKTTISQQCPAENDGNKYCTLRWVICTHNLKEYPGTQLATDSLGASNCSKSPQGFPFLNLCYITFFVSDRPQHPSVTFLQTNHFTIFLLCKSSSSQLFWSFSQSTTFTCLHFGEFCIWPESEVKSSWASKRKPCQCQSPSGNKPLLRD